MKRTIITILLLVCFMQVASAASAGQICNITPTLLNQDPYPAMPGESVKIVFQVNGLESSSSGCGDVSVKLVEEFPFSMSPGEDPIYEISSGTYLKNFKSFALVPYELFVDSDALEGENKLEVEIASDFSGGAATYSFDIEVTDFRTDFEISVKDYDPLTGILTFQILNTGENDVEALTVDIPEQEFIEVKGSARNIVGSLDSNDDTTFSFEAIPKDGDLKLIILYTDGINERRTLEETVSFHSKAFNGRAGQEQSTSIWFYITLIIVVVLAYRWYRNRKKKKTHSH